MFVYYTYNLNGGYRGSHFVLLVDYFCFTFDLLLIRNYKRLWREEQTNKIDLQKLNNKAHPVVSLRCAYPIFVIVPYIYCTDKQRWSVVRMSPGS